MIFLIILGVFLAPIVSWGVYKLRQTNRLTAQAERDALPFHPKPGATPNAFLRRFPSPERTYLRESLMHAGIMYLACSWSLTLLFSISLTLAPSKHAAWTDPSALFWFQYAHTASGASQFCLIFCSLATLQAILPMRQRPAAQYYRTRPLSIGFLFWARVLPTLCLVVASITTAAILSFALLVAIKGPVWQHLPSTFPGIITPDDDRPQLYLALLATSVPRIFLSLCTSMILFLSVFIASHTIPINRWSGGNASPLRPALLPLTGMLLGTVFILLDTMDVLHLPRQLFFYTRLGPPPPYIFALVPLLLSAGLLFLARFFIARLEI